MKKIIFICISIVSLFTFNACNSIKGEGNVKDKEIKTTKINEVEAEGNYRLVIVYDSSNPRVDIETYENLIDNLKVSVKGNKLIIKENKHVKSTDLYNVFVYTSDISTLNISDNVNAESSSQFRMKSFNLEVSDNAKFLGNNLILDKASVKITDNGEINLQGVSSEFKLKAEDNAKFSAPFFETDNLTISLSEVATAEVNVRGRMNGTLEDNSELIYIGNPIKNIKQKDLAKVKQK